MSDTSPGLNRTDAPTASNVQWMIQSAFNASASTDTAALTLPTGTSATSIAGYFSPSGSPVNLAVGDTLNVSFVFSLSNIGTATGTTAFRLGLFNSAGSRAADGFTVGGVETNFNDYTGYAPLLSTRANASGITIRERVTGTNNYLNSVSNPPFSAALATGASQVFAASTSYTATVSAKRTDTATVEIGITVAGGAFSNYGLSFIDTVAPTTSFDTLGIGWAGNLMAAGGVFTLHSAEVSVIPEPSAVGATLGLATLGITILRRRIARPSKSGA